MKTSDKALTILRVIEQDSERARQDYISQACAVVGRRASWEEKTKFDMEDGVGGFSTGPSDEEVAIRKMEEETTKLKEKWDRWEEVRLFAQETFLHMIPDDVAKAHLKPVKRVSEEPANTVNAVNTREMTQQEEDEEIGE